MVRFLALKYLGRETCWRGGGTLRATTPDDPLFFFSSLKWETSPAMAAASDLQARCCNRIWEQPGPGVRVRDQESALWPQSGNILTALGLLSLRWVCLSLQWGWLHRPSPSQRSIEKRNAIKELILRDSEVANVLHPQDVKTATKTTLQLAYIVGGALVKILGLWWESTNLAWWLQREGRRAEPKEPGTVETKCWVMLRRTGLHTSENSCWK